LDHFASPSPLQAAGVWAEWLFPFTGLDGSWLLAYAPRIPDLAYRSRGALIR
jgi:hypothetical protein